MIVEFLREFFFAVFVRSKFLGASNPYSGQTKTFYVNHNRKPSLVDLPMGAEIRRQGYRGESRNLRGSRLLGREVWRMCVMLKQIAPLFFYRCIPARKLGSIFSSPYIGCETTNETKSFLLACDLDLSFLR